MLYVYIWTHSRPSQHWARARARAHMGIVMDAYVCLHCKYLAQVQALVTTVSESH